MRTFSQRQLRQRVNLLKFKSNGVNFERGCEISTSVDYSLSLCFVCPPSLVRMRILLPTHCFSYLQYNYYERRNPKASFLLFDYIKIRAMGSSSSWSPRSSHLMCKALALSTKYNSNNNNHQMVLFVPFIVTLVFV